MSIQPKEFQKEKFTVHEPKKSEGAYDYATLAFGYGGRKFDFFLPGTDPANPGVNMTKISENPKKPGTLSQGVVIENDEDLLNMCKYIETEALNAVIKYKSHENMPKNLAKFKDVEQLKEMFPSVKLIVHFPKKKDEKGKATTEVEQDASPLLYFNLMRASLTGDKKGEIFTKYFSAQLLDQDIEAAVKRGERKESEFLFPVVNNPVTKARGLFESKSGMRGLPTIMGGDIFCSSDKIKIRMSLSNAYILGFRSSEPESRTKAKQVMAASGIRMTEALVMPNAPEENTEGGEPGNTVNNKIEPPPSSTKAGNYTVQIIGE